MILNLKQTVALDVLEDNITKELIFGGGAGGSKSFLGCFWLLKMCLKYPGTRWVMGRKKLKTLKETTFKSFLDVCKLQGVLNDIHFKINHQTNTIIFNNKSEILMKDLAYYPADPQFDELGSLEITGFFVDEVNQITQLAWQILKSRIRYKLDEYNLMPKALGTCNPSKGFIYKEFYKPNKEGALPPDKMFIQALVTDNPNIDKHYIDNLRSLPKAQRDRLLLGLWESDDDINTLIRYDNIVDIFTNSHVRDDKDLKYITCDVARLGADKAVIMVWHGFDVIELYSYDTSRINELQDKIISIKNRLSIPNSNIIADGDGVGGGLVDNLRIKDFVNNSRPINGENYYNLKTQCYYKLAELININGISISANVTNEQQEHIIEELEQIKSKDIDQDGKLKIVSKIDIKNNIGRSPDYSDTLMMRMWFTLNKNVGIYHL